MNLHNLQKVPDYKVKKWIEESIRELTPYQIQKMFDDEIVRFSPFEFYEERKVVSNFWIRLTIVLIPFVWLILFIGLPFKFIATGQWGYSKKMINWYDKWVSKVI